MPTRQTRQHARLKTHQHVSPLDQSAARITSHASTSSASLGVSERTHLLRLNDLLVLTAFFRAFGTFERIDTLPSGEINRLDTAFGKQSVDRFGIAIRGDATALSSL